MMNKKSTEDILQAPRGMRDFFGGQFETKKSFFNYAEQVAQSFGFQGIETPIMEHTEIFNKGIGAGTDIIDKEMYNLITLGGDMLTLRPEGTAPVMRSYIENGMGSLPQPQFLYYAGPFFRHDKPQKGRYRQLYQFGLEIMGSKDSLYDAMIIDAGYSIIKEYIPQIHVKINSLGTSSCRKQYTQKLAQFYEEHREKLGESDQRRIETNPLRILDSKHPDTVAVNKAAPHLIDELDDDSKRHFNEVTRLLESMNIAYSIDPFLVRGMDYYEHTVFEYIVVDDTGNESFALGGGGRYDGLAEMIGHTQSVPAVGLGLGVDRIIETSTKTIKPRTTNAIPILITDASLYDYARTILNSHNTHGKFFLFPLSNKLAKQISRVEKEGYTSVIIIGENEKKEQSVTYKNLATGKQDTLPLEKLHTV